MPTATYFSGLLKWAHGGPKTGSVIRNSETTPGRVNSDWPTSHSRYATERSLATGRVHDEEDENTTHVHGRERHSTTSSESTSPTGTVHDKYQMCFASYCCSNWHQSLSQNQQLQKQYYQWKNTRRLLDIWKIHSRCRVVFLHSFISALFQGHP